MELNIDRGLKSYDVKDADGTLIGTIRFNPSDIGLAGRMEEARAKIAEITAAPVTGPEDLVEWDRQVHIQSSASCPTPRFRWGPV